VEVSQKNLDSVGIRRLATSELDRGNNSTRSMSHCCHDMGCCFQVK
jgi:hypothetical protein